jgi:hypothetical protein
MEFSFFSFLVNTSVSKVVGYEVDVQSLIPGSGVVRDVQHDSDPILHIVSNT